MPTQCSRDSFDFGRVESRCVVADFAGGRITSDAGALLLGATDLCGPILAMPTTFRCAKRSKPPR